MSRPEPIFRADSITRTFGDRQVLKSASVWAWKGRITVLLGRNGCGKSTMLKIATGRLRGDQGATHYDGRVYLRPRLPVLARRGLFYLPSQDLLSTRLTVRQQIEAVEWRFRTGRAEDVVDRLGIRRVLDQVGAELSGGERRRAEVALALVRHPKCLLADEPFAGINPSDAEVVAEALQALATAGCALVITGHEVRQLMAVADEVVWMVAGTTHGLGSPAAATVHEQFRREYLGPGADRF